MNKRTHLFYLQLALTLVTCAFLLVPVIQSVLAGLTVNYIAGFKSGLTLRWMGEVWRLYSDTIFRSIGLGLACLAVDLIAGIEYKVVSAAADSKAKDRNLDETLTRREKFDKHIELDMEIVNALVGVRW